MRWLTRLWRFLERIWNGDSPPLTIDYPPPQCDYFLCNARAAYELGPEGSGEFFLCEEHARDFCNGVPTELADKWLRRLNRDK